MTASLPVLLQTKLAIPPTRTKLVSRPHLIEKLNTGLSRPLTLICAPAGFGKTTLVSEWHSSDVGRDIPVAWISLDEDDNDPNRFLAYLISALMKIDQLNNDELLSVLQTPQPPPSKMILTAIISKLEDNSERFVLVLDDYHLISSEPVHEAVSFLLDHIPLDIGLVIISREDPPFPLARLRARGQLTEIRTDDLRFTTEESGSFLRQMLGIQLSIDQIQELDRRTEGWIAGLQLAALAMKGRDDVAGFISAFTGSHRFILDYLAEEVLRRQSEVLQTFLLQTSILNRLSGPLCNAVTGRSDGQTLLEQIEHDNLFLISLDDERFWYRYHHLFGDMLRRHLHRFEPNNLQELHRRASQWFESSGWVGESIEHAILSQNSERVAELVEQHVESLWMRGKVNTVLRWLEGLPRQIILARPKLGLNYVFMLTIIDAFEEAGQILSEIEFNLNDLEVQDTEKTTLLGQAAAIRATILVQDSQDGDLTIAAGLQALAQLPETGDYWYRWVTMVVGIAEWLSNGNIAVAQHYLEVAVRLSEKEDDIYTLLVSLSYLTQINLIKGELNQIESSCHPLLQRAHDLGWRGQPALGIARLNRAWIRYERNDLEGAYEDVTVGLLAVRDYALKRVSMPGYVMLARLKYLQGDESGASESLQEAIEMMQGGKLRPVLISVSGWQAWLWLKQGNHTSAIKWARKIESTTDQLSAVHEFERLTLARIWIATGRVEESLEILTRLFAAANSADRKGRVIEIYVLQALAFKLQGNVDKAVQSIAYALSLGQPEGYMRTFIDEGNLMRDLLLVAQAQGIAVNYIIRLLAAFDNETHPEHITLQPNRIGYDIELPTGRELEILNLIAEGASNREVAQELFISVGTVKKHLNNIFLKLDAHSRTQAVAIAREYNIL